MPWAGYENPCRAENYPVAGGADGGYSPGLYAAADCPADTAANAGGLGTGCADRTAGFNADSSSVPDHDAGSTNANAAAGGNQQRG